MLASVALGLPPFLLANLNSLPTEVLRNILHAALGFRLSFSGVCKTSQARFPLAGWVCFHQWIGRGPVIYLGSQQCIFFRFPNGLFGERAKSPKISFSMLKNEKRITIA